MDAEQWVQDTFIDLKVVCSDESVIQYVASVLETDDIDGDFLMEVLPSMVESLETCKPEKIRQLVDRLLKFGSPSEADAVPDSTTASACDEPASAEIAPTRPKARPPVAKAASAWKQPSLSSSLVGQDAQVASVTGVRSVRASALEQRTETALRNLRLPISSNTLVDCVLKTVTTIIAPHKNYHSDEAVVSYIAGMSPSFLRAEFALVTLAHSDAGGRRRTHFV